MQKDAWKKERVKIDWNNKQKKVYIIKKSVKSIKDQNKKTKQRAKRKNWERTKERVTQERSKENHKIYQNNEQKRKIKIKIKRERIIN